MWRWVVRLGWVMVVECSDGVVRVVCCCDVCL